MIYMCYVIIMHKSFFDLIYGYNTSIRRIYSSKSISHGLEVNVSIMSYIINNEFESF